MSITWVPPTGLNDVTQFPDEDPLIRKHMQDLLQQVPDYADTQFATKMQENWIPPTLQNGWVDYSSGYTSGYMKDSLGFVHIRGGLKSGTTTVNTILFTLPAGYRPGTNKEYIVSSNSAAGDVIIDTNGNVRLQYGNNTFFSLENITPFKSEG